MPADDQSSSGNQAGPFMVTVGSAVNKRMAEMMNQGLATMKSLREQPQATEEVNQMLRDGLNDFANRIECKMKNRRKMEA
jgi:hypothetical protein